MRSPWLVVVPLLICVAFLAYGVWIWWCRRRYTRERFAFAALSAILFLVGTAGASPLAHSTPWHLVAGLLNAFLHTDIRLSEPSLIHYAFLNLTCWIAMEALVKLHQQWDGGRSFDQYNREQRREAPSLALEGIRELHRIVKQAPQQERYDESVTPNLSVQLEPAEDSLAWKDQARELVRLSSSSYSFPPDAWHDIAHCWVGMNINTKDAVFLFPCTDPPDEAEIAEMLDYAERIAPGRRHLEILVASRTEQERGERSTVAHSGSYIRFVSEPYLLNRLVDFTDYRNEIVRRVEVSKLGDSQMCLRDVYVPSLVAGEVLTAERNVRRSKRQANGNIEHSLLEWLREGGPRQLALLAEYGQGKSTAALMFTYRLLQNPAISNRVPLLIELRGTCPRNLTPLQMLATWSAQYNINPQALMRLHAAGRLLLIFDGFDEMALVGDAEMRLKHFRTLWQFAYPGAKILITGRPNFFFDGDEMRAALGTEKPLSGRPYCCAIRLSPFDGKQISAALRNYKPSVQAQICSLAGRNRRFRDLVSRPSLLFIVSVLWERENLSEKVDQLTSAFVMDLFVRHSYRRQGLKEQGRPDFMALTSAERAYFMEGVAACMASQRMPNQISGRQLNSLIDVLVDAIPDAVSTQSSALSGGSAIPLRTRLKDAQYGIEHVRTDVRACGLLVDDPAAPGTFRFGHKSFMEYLFAALLAEVIQDDRCAKAQSILAATRASIDDVQELPVSVEFLAELVESQRTHPEGGTGPSLDRSHNEAFLAEKLLRAILGENDSVFRPRQTAVCCLVWILSTQYLKPIPRSVRLLGIACSVIVLLVLRPSALDSSRLGASPDLFGVGSLAFAVIIAAIGVVLLGFVVKDLGALCRVSHSSLMVKMRVWTRICRECGVSDSAMRQAVGYGRPLWGRDHPFDHFVPRISSPADDVGKEAKGG